MRKDSSESELFPEALVGRGISRRAALLATTASLFAILLDCPSSALAAESALDDAAFLDLSRVMTGYADLDPVIAARLFDAMRTADPGFGAAATRLATLDHDSRDPDTLLQAASREGLRDSALALVAAWYTGSVGTKSDGAVVAYANALMYRPIRDALPAPTYCGGGPLWWTAEPPPLRRVTEATP
jgi:hypothetical protein